RCQVGPGLGLREKLAPDLLAGQDGPQVAPLLGIRADMGDRRAGEVLADDVEPLRRAGPVTFLREDGAHPLVEALAAVPARPGEPGIPGVEDHALPLSPEGRL